MKTYEEFKRDIYIECFKELRAYPKTEVEQWLRKPAQEADIRFEYEESKKEYEQGYRKYAFIHGINRFCLNAFYCYDMPDD